MKGLNSSSHDKLEKQMYDLAIQMRVLNVVTIMFLPLNLIAGIYGMNFVNIPELHWQYGYYAVLTSMFIISCTLGRFFWKRKWI